MDGIGPFSRRSLCFWWSQPPTFLVGTNHLGHFYLNHLLLPKIETSSGKIVVTASGVHDPESPGGAQGKTATLGNLEGFERDGKNFEMVDGEPYNGDKAYKDSKVREQWYGENGCYMSELRSNCALLQLLGRSSAMSILQGNSNEDSHRMMPPKTLWSTVSALA
jgi:hypothetical protein